MAKVLVEVDCPRCGGRGVLEAYCLACRETVGWDSPWWLTPAANPALPCGHDVARHLAGTDYCGMCEGARKVRRFQEMEMVEAPVGLAPRESGSEMNR